VVAGKWGLNEGGRQAGVLALLDRPRGEGDFDGLSADCAPSPVPRLVGALTRLIGILRLAQLGPG
jgi:hypothetical protein